MDPSGGVTVCAHSAPSGRPQNSFRCLQLVGVCLVISSVSVLEAKTHLKYLLYALVVYLHSSEIILIC